MARLYSGGPLIDREAPFLVDSPTSRSQNSPSISDFAGEENSAALVVADVSSPRQSESVHGVVESEPSRKESQPDPGTVELGPHRDLQEVSGNPVQNPPLKGAWAKKLTLPHASTSRQSTFNQEKWPSLSGSSPSHSLLTRDKQVTRTTVAVEDAIRFPWAAKMHPASRNLYRATEPEYLEDGTPKVTIPSHVFSQGLENQKEYILGQFHRCSPPSGGLIYAVFNKLWGRNCKITIRKLGDSSYLFHIPDESTRTWVLQRGLWHVDDCLMFVASWNPEASFAIPEIKTIPVWVTLKKIPNILYSIDGISHIASGLGAPLATHKPRLDPILMGEAKILVEVELSKTFPSRIAAVDEEGSTHMVDVDYAWLPSKCGRCGQLGHKVKRCLQAVSESPLVGSKDIAIESNASVVVATSTPNTVSKSLSISTSYIASVPTATVDDYISLATISALENMYVAPTMITINESIECPVLDAAQPVLIASTTIAQPSPTFQMESNSSVEIDLGSNKFASLVTLEENSSDPIMDLMETMTPSGKRILRDRPVRPSAKAMEMSQSSGRGRGNRGRGNRGGRG